MCNFYVGQKVVCINAKPIDLEYLEMDGLVLNEIYTVREVGLLSGELIEDTPEDEGVPFVKLEEIDRSSKGWEKDKEVPYYAWRFRPLTDISVFERLLEGAPVDVNEPVDA